MFARTTTKNFCNTHSACPTQHKPNIYSQLKFVCCCCCYVSWNGANSGINFVSKSHLEIVELVLKINPLNRPHTSTAYVCHSTKIVFYDYDLFKDAINGGAIELAGTRHPHPQAILERKVIFLVASLNHYISHICHLPSNARTLYPDHLPSRAPLSLSVPPKSVRTIEESVVKSASQSRKKTHTQKI